MGMYTELVCAFELKNETPNEILEILKYMTESFDSQDEIENLPNHKLFEDGSRWRFMLRSDSYYFDGTTNSFLKVDYLYPEKPSYYLNVRCNLKNYNDEIENFIDWLKPYINYAGNNDYFIGYSRYEEAKEPSLIYV